MPKTKEAQTQQSHKPGLKVKGNKNKTTGSNLSSLPPRFTQQTHHHHHCCYTQPPSKASPFTLPHPTHS